MSIGAAHAERTHAGDFLLLIGPRRLIREDLYCDLVPRDVRIGCFKIQLAWNGVVLHGK